MEQHLAEAEIEAWSHGQDWVMVKVTHSVYSSKIFEIQLQLWIRNFGKLFPWTINKVHDLTDVMNDWFNKYRLAKGWVLQADGVTAARACYHGATPISFFDIIYYIFFIHNILFDIIATSRIGSKAMLIF